MGPPDRVAPWEAATALCEVLASRPDIDVELLLGAESLTETLGDHPLAAHARVRGRTVAARVDTVVARGWAAGLDVLLLPYRRASHSAWIPLCDELGTAVVSVQDSTPRVGLAASYPDHPSGRVDPDEVSAALLTALDARQPSRRPSWAERGDAAGHGRHDVGAPGVCRSARWVERRR